MLRGLLKLYISWNLRSVLLIQYLNQILFMLNLFILVAFNFLFNIIFFILFNSSVKKLIFFWWIHRRIFKSRYRIFLIKSFLYFFSIWILIYCLREQNIIHRFILNICWNLQFLILYFLLINWILIENFKSLSLLLRFSSEFKWRVILI